MGKKESIRCLFGNKATCGKVRHRNSRQYYIDFFAWAKQCLLAQLLLHCHQVLHSFDVVSDDCLFWSHARKRLGAASEKMLPFSYCIIAQVGHAFKELQVVR